MNKATKDLYYVLSLGYSVDKDGCLLKNGKKTSTKKVHNTGYIVFQSRRPETRKNFCVFLHRIQAYQKYKEKLFERGIEVRHIDGNKLNNRWDNIIIGTHSENMFDVSKEMRDNRTEKGAACVRLFDEEKLRKILSDRAAGLSLNQLSKRYNCSKSTMSYIINKKTYKKFRKK